MENYVVYLDDQKDGVFHIHEISSKYQTIKCHALGEELSLKELKEKYGKEKLITFTVSYPNNDCESIRLHGESAVEHSGFKVEGEQKVTLCPVCHPDCSDH